MEILHCNAIGKIKQNKAKLEKALNIRIYFSGKNISIEGAAIDEYVAVNAIEALELGFSFEQSILLRDEEIILEKLNIKDITKRHDLKVIRARIIGTRGKTKSIMENLSDCFISLHDNTIGIIGKAEDIKKAMQALTSLIHGSKQSRVYSYLERQRGIEKSRFNEDLGLKIKRKK